MTGRERAWRAVAAACIGVAGGALQAAPVQPGLERPALAVRQPGRVVMLGVTTVPAANGTAAAPRLVAVGERGVVSLSDDGGRSWRQAKAPVSVTLTSVRFANDRVGLATGHGGVVLATADRGESWKLVLDGRRIAQTLLARARASGDETALKDAERLVADGPDKPLLDLLMLDERRAWVVGAYGLALATEDGGATWTSWQERLDNPKGAHLYALRKRGDTVLVGGEQGLLLLSGDGGQTFRRLESPYRGSWFTAELPDERTLLVAGLRGNAWRSVDGGASWTTLNNPIPASFTASTVNAKGQVLLASQAGFVLAVEGERLVPLHAAPVPSPAGLTDLGGQILTVGLRGAMPMPSAPGANPKPPQENSR